MFLGLLWRKHRDLPCPSLPRSPFFTGGQWLRPQRQRATEVMKRQGEPVLQGWEPGDRSHQRQVTLNGRVWWGRVLKGGVKKKAIFFCFMLLLWNPAEWMSKLNRTFPGPAFTWMVCVVKNTCRHCPCLGWKAHCPQGSWLFHCQPRQVPPCLSCLFPPMPSSKSNHSTSRSSVKAGFQFWLLLKAVPVWLSSHASPLSASRPQDCSTWTSGHPVLSDPSLLPPECWVLPNTEWASWGQPYATCPVRAPDGAKHRAGARAWGAAGALGEGKTSRGRGERDHTHREPRQRPSGLGEGAMAAPGSISSPARPQHEARHTGSALWQPRWELNERQHPCWGREE